MAVHTVEKHFNDATASNGLEGHELSAVSCLSPLDVYGLDFSQIRVCPFAENQIPCNIKETHWGICFKSF